MPNRLTDNERATRAITESEWQATVMDIAQMCGWYVAHFRPAQRADGRWITPVSGNAAGFPDLVLVRERVLFVELKRERGTVSPAQTQWLHRLRRAKCEAYVWRPSDADHVVEVLK
jgi:hypothetical protein